MSDNGWNSILVKSQCVYAKIIHPVLPPWSKQGQGTPMYSMALLLSDAQAHRLRTKGYKGSPKFEESTSRMLYNFNRSTLSKKGNRLPSLQVLRWDKKPFTLQVGDGSTVITLLEYHEYSAGVDSKGSPYPGGVTWRLGAVQIVDYVEYVEPEPKDNTEILDRFSVLPTPENVPDMVEDKFDKLTPPSEVNDHVADALPQVADAAGGVDFEKLREKYAHKTAPQKRHIQSQVTPSPVEDEYSSYPEQATVEHDPNEII